MKTARFLSGVFGTIFLFASALASLGSSPSWVAAAILAWLSAFAWALCVFLCNVQIRTRAR